MSMVWMQKGKTKTLKKYAENYNKKYDETNTQTDIYFGERE
jgi:hypothetical protein